MSSIGFLGDAGFTASDACLESVAPPTFAGISSLAALGNGFLQPGWPAASVGASVGPLSYAIYIAVGSVTAAVLFQPANRYPVFAEQAGKPRTALLAALADRVTYLTKGQTYTVGVRAVSAVGVEDANTVILTAVSQGVVPDMLTQLYAQLNATLSGGICDLVGEIDDNDDVEGVLDDC